MCAHYVRYLSYTVNVKWIKYVGKFKLLTIITDFWLH